MVKASGNLFHPLPENRSKEVFEKLLEQESLLIERIVSFGQITPEGEWYDQTTDEWVLMVQGNGKILFEDNTVKTLKQGDYLFIPRHTKHRVIETSEDAIWLAVHIKN